MRAFLVGTVIGICADEFKTSAEFERFKVAMKLDGAVDVKLDKDDDRYQVNVTFRSSEPYKKLITRVENVFTEAVLKKR